MNVTILTGIRAERVKDAALIWAEATAARDNDTDIPTAAEALPVLKHVLEVAADAELFSAYCEGVMVGFALVETIAAGVTELRYLGVAPDAWGHAVASQLLDAIACEMRRRGCSRLELWVYDDNKRAVRLYERKHWLADGSDRVHARSGRREQRHVRNL